MPLAMKHDSKEKRRLVKNVGANGLGIFVTVFNQICLLPIYLHCWSVELYGDWIALSALSTFFASSDLGFTTVFTNEFVVEHARNNREKCHQILTNNNGFLMMVFLPLVLLLILFLRSSDLVSVLGLHSLDNTSARIILFVLVIHVFLTMLGKVPNAIYRANRFAHKAFLIDNLVWLSESIIIAVALLARLSPVFVAVGIAIPRLVILFYKWIDTRALFSYSFALRNVSFNDIKSSVLPSLSMVSFPLSNTVVMQGLSLIVNKFFGASELVLFNTTRTLGNMIKFGSSVVTTSFYPEFAVAYGQEDISKIKRLNSYCTLSAIVISVLSIVVILPFGEWIFSIWTGEKVAFSFSLMATFLIVIVIDNYWNALIAPLVSTNMHSFLGIISLILSVLVVLLAFVFSMKSTILLFVVLIQLVLHIPMSFIVFNARKRLIKKMSCE